MKIMVFDTHKFEKEAFCRANEFFKHDLIFQDFRLTEKSVMTAKGVPCVCAFVSDTLNSSVLNSLKAQGTKLIALRSAGFNHVDLGTAKKLGLTVVRVPEYSPYSVAEHAVALILALNRKIFRSYNRVREGNFSLEGLEGFDLHGKTVGVIGTGKIGQVFASIMRGFGTKVLAYDIHPNETLSQELGISYVSFEELLTKSDIISLHLPLTAASQHLIDAKAFSLMKDGVFLINTSRGKVIETQALIAALKSKKIGAAGLDVYEEEEGLFFEDHSNEILTDDIFMRLLTFPNVLITGHQAFLTKEALRNIAETTLKNVSDFEAQRELKNIVKG